MILRFDMTELQHTKPGSFTNEASMYIVHVTSSCAMASQWAVLTPTWQRMENNRSSDADQNVVFRLRRILDMECFAQIHFYVYVRLNRQTVFHGRHTSRIASLKPNHAVSQQCIRVSSHLATRAVDESPGKLDPDIVSGRHLDIIAYYAAVPLVLSTCALACTMCQRSNRLAFSARPKRKPRSFYRTPWVALDQNHKPIHMRVLRSLAHSVDLEDFQSSDDESWPLDHDTTGRFTLHNGAYIRQ